MKKKEINVAEGFQKDHMLTRSQKRLIFYCLVFALPLLQFCIFYIYVNINTFVYAFSSYKIRTDGVPGYNITFTFDNVVKAWTMFWSAGRMIRNSVVSFASSFIIVTTAGLLFSYYVAKKYMLAGFFRVTLYLPHIVSGVVLTLLYKYIVNDVFAVVSKQLFSAEFLEENKITYGLLASGVPYDIQYGALLFYSLWMGFGGNVLIYSGTMSAIDNSIIESAQLDGVNVLQEFWHIYIPMIFPTIVTFIVTGFTGIFTGQMGLYTIFGEGAPGDLRTMGYFIFVSTKHGSLYQGASGFFDFCELAALGILITAIVVPVTMITRKLLETYGPRTD